MSSQKPWLSQNFQVSEEFEKVKDHISVQAHQQGYQAVNW
jgi:hypothetical protein